MNGVVRAKTRAIRDHIQRIRVVDLGTLDGLRDDLLRQESILLNLLRACQSAIDLAHHLSEGRGLGVPDDSRDAFTRLERAGLIPAALAQHLRAMVGFRNIAVHRYHQLSLLVLRQLIDHRLDDLLTFADEADRLHGGH